MLADALQYARACPNVRARRYYNRKAYDIQIEHIEQASSFKASDNIEIVYVCLCVFMKKNAEMASKIMSQMEFSN